MIQDLVEEAVAGGARRWKACEVLGLPARTLERWAHKSDDMRHGPKHVPANKLSPAEREEVLEIATSAEFRDRSAALRFLHAAVTVVALLFASMHASAARMDLDPIIGDPPELSTET